ncbi:hypothetical protein EXIGLDRAFT_87477 [Exidia glandulosa HHB12029]|uniref:Zn(2)-C6 fungal-type domain-containing protein n=1 Tax=Exidia glandulosa HHB12029 TaxID=1314781 RepID=A0A165HDW1_EXIGL|nr:hypothetical protein EXIGLDRAFT_87477 [Exidia glandulosa HHB12029]
MPVTDATAASPMPKAHEPTVNKACQPCRTAKVACKRGSVDSVCQRCEAQGLECVGSTQGPCCHGDAGAVATGKTKAERCNRSPQREI